MIDFVGVLSVDDCLLVGDVLAAERIDVEGAHMDRLEEASFEQLVRNRLLQVANDGNIRERAWAKTKFVRSICFAALCLEHNRSHNHAFCRIDRTRNEVSAKLAIRTDLRSTRYLELFACACVHPEPHNHTITQSHNHT